MIERLKPHLPEQRSRVLVAAAGAVALGATVAHGLLHKNKENKLPKDNYYDFVGALSQFIEIELGEDTPDHFLLGGGISAALCDEGTVIEPPIPGSDIPGQIIVSDDLHKDRVRDNGRVADIDCFIKTADPQIRQRVRKSLTPLTSVLQDPTSSPQQIDLENSKPGNYLSIGVCGLTPVEEYSPTNLQFLGRLTQNLKKDFVSQRVDEGEGSLSWRIADIVQELPEESFQRWDLVLKDGSIVPTLHPVIILACYAARASHGVRKRDREKIDAMVKQLAPVFGVGVEWDKKKRRAKITAADPDNPAYGAAVKFVNAKNELRYTKTRERMGRNQAGLLAAKLAIHRFADTHLVRFGQGGFIYKKFTSRFSDEDQSDFE